MKVLLVALNAKYIHSSLSIRYLKNFCKEAEDISINEYTINDRISNIVADIYKEKANIVAFSCYIWNIEMVLNISDILKKVQPSIKIILGGPEVSYDAQFLLKKHHFIDYIVVGEGEQTFKEMIEHLSNEKTYIADIPGLVLRDKHSNIITTNSRTLIKDLGIIPFPYNKSDMEELSDKIIYYETSRGCPFNCSYCLSSTISGVRYFSLDRVKKDLLFFIKNKVRQVKLVDRTFNCNIKRANEVFEFLLENYQEGINFHFEMAGDLLDDETIKLLGNAPKGYFQFEIGVQSTNISTTETINRKTNFEKIAENVRRLKEKNNIHIHLDLIAGLPEEDYKSFKKSFDDVFALKPHMLQLGFLKLLKGSLIREQAQKFKYEYTTLPPYEILNSKWIEYDGVLKLKLIEDVLDKYYNSRAFEKSLEILLLLKYISPFELFESLAMYFESEGLNYISHSRRALYDILFNFVKSNEINPQSSDLLNIFAQYLKFDLLYNNYGVNLPKWGQGQVVSGFKEKCFEFLKSNKNIEEFLPHYCGLPAKKIYRQVKFEVFDFDVLQDNSTDVLREYRHSSYPLIYLFDYYTKKIYDVTEKIV
jgi:radical SAM superfamily enzyme YgiQ (UPF0313 family)